MGRGSPENPKRVIIELVMNENRWKEMWMQYNAAYFCLQGDK